MKEYKFRFCYEISADASLGIDDETGEAAVVYVNVNRSGSRELTEDEYDEVHNSHRPVIAELFDIDISQIKCISASEYDNETE